jgi:hypothetical protein
MKIIVPGKNLGEADPRREQCHFCGCIWEFMDEEVARFHDWTGTYYTLKCPHCNGAVRRWKVDFPFDPRPVRMKNVNQQGVPDPQRKL